MGGGEERGGVEGCVLRSEFAPVKSGKRMGEKVGWKEGGKERGCRWMWVWFLWPCGYEAMGL